jgi:hypothetical protein
MENKKEDQSTTKSLAIEFVKNAAAAIEAQLKIEIVRNGFTLDNVRKGKTKIDRVVNQSEKDARFVIESFVIKGRVILAVKWAPSGFTMERNNQEVANAVSVNPKFGIKKTLFGGGLNLVKSASKREIEIEARAAEYQKEFLKNRN